MISTLKQLGAFVGWLSGSLAGVVAILYAAGFIATLAHVRLLGLDFDLVSRDPFFYISRGGNVFPRIFLGFIVPFLIVFLVIGGIHLALSLIRKGNTADKRARKIGFIAANTATVAVMTLLSFIAVREFINPALGLKGILFLGTEELCSAVDNEIQGALITQNRAVLDDRFFQVAFACGVVAALGLYGARRIFKESASRVLLVGYLAATFIAILLMPIAHGLFVLRTELPRVTIGDGNLGGNLDLGDELRLLRHGPGGLLLWSYSDRKVIWIAQGVVKSFQVGQSEPLFPNARNMCLTGGGK